MTINLGNVDWTELRHQKQVLAVVIQRLQTTGQTHESEPLDGILSLLDHLQDEAAMVLGQRKVYGK